MNRRKFIGSTLAFPVVAAIPKFEAAMDEIWIQAATEIKYPAHAIIGVDSGSEDEGVAMLVVVDKDGKMTVLEEWRVPNAG